MRSGKGGPFAAVVVKDGEILALGVNQVTSTFDPTAHAEIVAIREACRTLGQFQLAGCEIYTTCEPCPMCLGAIYWARPAKVYFGATAADAAAVRIRRFVHLPAAWNSHLRALGAHGPDDARRVSSRLPGVGTEERQSPLLIETEAGERLSFGQID